MTLITQLKNKTRKQKNKNPEHFHKSTNVIRTKLTNTYLQNSTECYFYELIQPKRAVFVLFKEGQGGESSSTHEIKNKAIDLFSGMLFP